MENKKDLTKYVSSFVLGDGYLTKGKYQGNNIYNTVRNAKYVFKQVEDHKDYVDFQCGILSDLTRISIHYTEPYTDARGYSCKGQLALYTQHHPFYTTLYNNIYGIGRRSIVNHYMNLWDLETMAFLYMDNGWIELKEQIKSTYIRVGIATNAYSFYEVKVLRDFMHERFGFNFDVKRQKKRSGLYQPILRTSKDNAKRFLDSISKYMFPSFEYKLFSERCAPNSGDDIVWTSEESGESSRNDSI